METEIVNGTETGIIVGQAKGTIVPNRVNNICDYTGYFKTTTGVDF